MIQVEKNGSNIFIQLKINQNGSKIMIMICKIYTVVHVKDIHFVQQVIHYVVVYMHYVVQDRGSYNS